MCVCVCVCVCVFVFVDVCVWWVTVMAWWRARVYAYTRASPSPLYPRLSPSPHLQARVDLQEVELAAVLVHQELHSAGRAVAAGGAQRHRGAGQGGAQRVVDQGRGRLLQHLNVVWGEGGREDEGEGEGEGEVGEGWGGVLWVGAGSCHEGP